MGPLAFLAGKECKLESQGNGFFSRASGGTMPYQHLDFNPEKLI